MVSNMLNISKSKTWFQEVLRSQLNFFKKLTPGKSINVYTYITKTFKGKGNIFLITPIKNCTSVLSNLTFSFNISVWFYLEALI
jgi:hypothetical protein